MFTIVASQEEQCIGYGGRSHVYNFAPNLCKNNACAQWSSTLDSSTDEKVTKLKTSWLGYDKSADFPGSQWERFNLEYDADDVHRHSPWELLDKDTEWEQTQAQHSIDFDTRKTMLSLFAKLCYIFINTGVINGFDIFKINLFYE
nr:PH-interacting protein isoform X1 [Tanacetum cinerariifolium]